MIAARRVSRRIGGVRGKGAPRRGVALVFVQQQVGGALFVHLRVVYKVFLRQRLRFEVPHRLQKNPTPRLSQACETEPRP